MKGNIALIGFMGAGKSAVGRVLAEKLHMEYVELDSLIIKKAEKSIAEIFKEDGESVFRQIEIDTVKEAAQQDRVVIACGGGIILNDLNIERLRQTSMIVYLTAQPSVILKRVAQHSEKRPLLEVADPSSAVDNLLKFRKPLYERAADITIDTSDLTIDGVVSRIISELLKDASFNSQK